MAKRVWGPKWQWWVVVCHNDDGNSPFGFRPFWAASDRGAIRKAGIESGAIELETIYSRLSAIGCGRHKSDAETKYQELAAQYRIAQQVYQQRLDQSVPVPTPGRKVEQLELFG